MGGGKQRKSGRQAALETLQRLGYEVGEYKEEDENSEYLGSTRTFFDVMVDEWNEPKGNPRLVH